MSYFTVDEANAALPKIRGLLVDLRAAVAELERMRGQLATGDDGEITRPEPDTRVEPLHLRAVLRFHGSLSRLHDLGLELKDIEKGLLDFPALDGGREIRLCWKDGEESVAWFHEVDAGFKSRRPIAELGSTTDAGPRPTDDQDD